MQISNEANPNPAGRTGIRHCDLAVLLLGALVTLAGLWAREITWVLAGA
jgi:hypothetical protein